MSLMKALFSTEMFRHDLKRYRGLAIAFGILLFLCGPFAILFIVSLIGQFPIVFDDASILKSDNLDVILITACSVFSIMAGAISSCAVSSRYSKKNSSYFYASLPVKKSAMFITDTLCAFLIYAFCLALNAALTVGVVALTTEGIFAEATKLIIKIAASGIAYFFVGYSVFCFAGQICAAVYSQFIFGTTLMFYFSVLEIILLTAVITFDPNVDFDFYLSYAAYLSPFVAVIAHKVPVWIWLIISAGLTAIALGVFVRRNSENSGDAIAVLWGRYLIRALYIIPASIGGTVMFYNMSGGSFLWTAVGFAIAAVLTHMIINALIFKNASKLFYGVISFAVICGISIASIMMIKADTFGIFAIPDAGHTKSVSLEEVTLKSEENIKKLLDIVEDDVTKWEYYDNPENYNTVNLVYYKSSGLPVARNVYVKNSEKTDSVISEIESSEEYRLALFNKHYAYIDGFDKNVTNAYIYNFNAGKSGAYGKIDAKKLAQCILADLKENPTRNYDEDCFVCDILLESDSAPVSQMSGYDYYYHYSSLVRCDNDGYIAEIISSMTETVAYLKSLGYDFSSETITEKAVRISEDGNDVAVKGDEKFDELIATLLEERENSEYTYYFDNSGMTIIMDDGSSIGIAYYSYRNDKEAIYSDEEPTTEEAEIKEAEKSKETPISEK